MRNHRTCTVIALTCAVTLLIVSCGGGSPSSSVAPTPIPSPAPAPTPAATSGTFSGTVRDATTSAPLVNATITILDGPNATRSATSDTTGTFTLANVTFSTFTLRTTASTYDTASQTVAFTASTSLTVSLARTRLALSGLWPGGMATIDGNFSEPIITTSITQTGTTFAAGITHETFGTSVSSTAIVNGFLSNEFPGATLTGTVVFRTPSTTGGVTCVTGSIALTGTITSANAITLTAAAPFQYTNCRGTVTGYTITLLR